MRKIIKHTKFLVLIGLAVLSLLAACSSKEEIQEEESAQIFEQLKGGSGKIGILCPNQPWKPV